VGFFGGGGGGAKAGESHVDTSLPSSSKVKNQWKYTSSPPPLHALKAQAGISGISVSLGFLHEGPGN